MVSALYTIEIRGEKVNMLFSPRLYMYAGKDGVTLQNEGTSAAELMSLYADIMYCAALNHWTLTHTGDEDFPYTRIDFHAFAAERDAFMKAMLHAMQALSGKSLDELKKESADKKKA
jgi:hypothetical protein